MFHIEPEIGSRHLYAVHHSSSRQASLELFPGQIWIPGFDVSCTLSTPHQWFTRVRLPISHLTRSCPAFSVMLTTLALNQRSLRRFETCSCKPISEGLPPSSMQLRTKTIVLLIIAFCAHGTPDPDDRAGERYEITLHGGSKDTDDVLGQRIRDLHRKSKDGSHEYKQYRGGTYPVYEDPPKLGLVEKVRGERSWIAWASVHHQMVTDALILLGDDKPSYVSIHEKKVGRYRWVRSISALNVDPAVE